MSKKRDPETNQFSPGFPDRALIPAGFPTVTKMTHEQTAQQALRLLKAANRRILRASDLAQQLREEDPDIDSAIRFMADARECLSRYAVRHNLRED